MTYYNQHGPFKPLGTGKQQRYQGRNSTNKIILIICRGFEVWVESDHFSDEGVTLLLNLLPCTILTSVQPLALAVVDGLRRGRPESNGRQRTRQTPLIPLGI